MNNNFYSIILRQKLWYFPLTKVKEYTEEEEEEKRELEFHYEKNSKNE